MKRLIWALLFFVPILMQGQNQSIFFSSNAPEFIPYGKPFELFTTIKFPNSQFDEVNFYIFSESRITILDASVYNSSSLIKVKAEETDYGDFTQAYRISVSKADTSFDFNNVFRFKFTLSHLYEDNAKINYAVEYLRNHKVTETISSLKKNGPINSSVLSFYKPQQAAGRCLLLQESSYLNLDASPEGSHANLLAEFWAKMNNFKSDFFRIASADNGESYFSIGINDNSFIYLNDFSKTFYTGLSLSKNSWYHISVYLINDKIRVYCNSRFIYENSLSKNIKDEELRLSFVNESPDSYLYIKQLRLWNFQEDIEKCFANRQYSYFSPDRSELLYQNLFNDEIYPQQTGGIKISDMSRLRIVPSDAPIISRAPEINITVFSAYCSVEWSNRDNQKPKNFVVEKSRDGSTFAEVFKTTADEDLNKVYYYSDKREDIENVAYYRVKQINYDGSEIYSSSLKVGQSANKEKMKVGQNYPNPFNPTTSFSVEMFETAEAVINVYDLVGKTIKTIHEGTLTKGIHTFSFDGSSLPSGIYFYEIKTPASSIIKKMILTK